MKEEISFDTHLIQVAVMRAALNCPDRRISYSELETATGIAKKILKDCAEELEVSGVGKVERGYYVLPSLPDLILPAVILCGLKSRMFGRRIFSYKSLGSTNDTAKRLAESNSPEGTIVVADRQTKGRGRLGRSWHSPQNKGLYFSSILRPQIPIENLPALSLVAALSVCRAVEIAAGLEPAIKWPNDCLINGKKVAGILVDISAELGRVSYAVLGVGINVNMTNKDFPAKLLKTATSLSIETGKTFQKVELLRGFLIEFEKTYRNFCQYGLRFIAPELVKRSSVIGRQITFKQEGKKYDGVALGYDENGGLRVKLRSGVKILTGGEITLKK